MTEKSNKPAKKTPAKKTPAPAAKTPQRKPRAKKADGIAITPNGKFEGVSDAEFERRVYAILEDYFAPRVDATLAERKPSRWARFFGIK